VCGLQVDFGGSGVNNYTPLFLGVAVESAVFVAGVAFLLVRACRPRRRYVVRQDIPLSGAEWVKARRQAARGNRALWRANAGRVGRHLRVCADVRRRQLASGEWDRRDFETRLRRRQNGLGACIVAPAPVFVAGGRAREVRPRPSRRARSGSRGDPPDDPDDDPSDLGRRGGKLGVVRRRPWAPS
jgi:hypothetical protein